MPSPNKSTERDKKNQRILLQYAGLATQFLFSIGLAVFLGLKADGWFHFSLPLLVWILPLCVIIGMIIKIVKDTSNK